MESLSSIKNDSWLSWFSRGLILLGLFFLIARLGELQIIKGGYFRNLAEGNRIRRVPISAPRGKIFARGGEVLAGNQEIKRKIEFNPDYGYQKTDDIDSARQDELVTEWMRTYSLGDKFAHVSGYLGEVSENELGKIDPLCPERGPKVSRVLVGRSGLEEEYDCILSGVDGEELIEVDTSGRRIRTLGKREPIPGEDIKTTIDFNLQEEVAKLMAGKTGAIIVSDPKGEVLALYSAPSYDPKIFVTKDSQNKINQVLNDNNLPMFNRVIGGIYHPGSVFKPIVAIAGLEEGVIDENYQFDDPGLIQVNEFSYSNWYFTQYGKTEGRIGIVKAIGRSTDTFFYKLGEKLGVDRIVDWAKRFGLNEKTGIDLPGEVEGLVPDPIWKQKTKGERWFLGNTYHMSIGQGDLALTPIAINTEVATIAFDGRKCTPVIVGDTKCIDLEISEKTLNIIKQGMEAACSTGGTGYTFFDFEPKVACKTGTAETNEEGITHAWFSVFGPYDSAGIVATVLVEKGGEGSSVAGPIARDIFNYWFKKYDNPSTQHE